MKSPIDLLHLILTECGDRCSVSTDRDFKRIAARVEHEGFSFLAITLASFGKSFTKALDLGGVSHVPWLGFEFRQGLPVLLRGFLENVFDMWSGDLLSDPCIDCIRSVRQITLMWAKVNAPATPARESAVIQSWLECESDVRSNNLSIEESGLQGARDSRLRRMFAMLLGGNAAYVLGHMAAGTLRPRYGPGATSERLSSNGRWRSGYWPESLERVFPQGDYSFPSYSAYLNRAGTEDEGAHQDPGICRPVRVITVPKTLDKPRVISIEPANVMYMQQAMKDAFERSWASPRLFGRVNIPHFMIRYSSQSPNQELARIGSLDGSLATLDLSEASDRVSNGLVKAMFGNYPELLDALQACRTETALLPKGDIHHLEKYASMGSALTFPVESMVFLVIVFLGIEQALNRRLSRKDIKSLIGSVRIYGDDIIIPTEYTGSVISSLESFGFKVGVHKSFWNGKFRESCGADYYDGVDVNIVRLRRTIPQSQKQAEALIAFAEFRNQLYLAGYWKTVRAIDRHVERIIPFPAAAQGASGITKVSFLGYSQQRWDSKLQRPLVKAAVPVYKKRRDSLDGERALMKFFNNKLFSDEEIYDKEHLLFAGRPQAVDIKLRWVHPDYGMSVGV